MKNNTFLVHIIIKVLCICLLLAMMFMVCQNQKEVVYTIPTSYDEYPNYSGKDLGITYTPKQTTLKVWSPGAEAMKVRLYAAGDGGEAIKEETMRRDENGVWSMVLKGNMAGKYYTVQVKHKDKWLSETPDPYAKAVGLNGQRGMILDLKSTNPTDWSTDKRPQLDHYTDILVYELHVRDLSTHPSSNIQNKGRFVGLTETGTSSPQGEKTGLDHIKELGATHVHLLPSFDFMPRSVDEANQDEKFNWGYDPQHYNIPEGAYSTNPRDGIVRIKEFKQMVQTLHNNGLRVVLDVVYNHTGETENSVFNQVAPGYFYRFNEDGSFSNASGCGNETASDRQMMRKYMLESMRYWVEEYHIDGFRVDLMAIHDIETMNEIAADLHQIDSSIFVYGEGWTAGDSPLPVERRSLKAHATQLKNVAVFSDDVRDGLKGSVFDHKDTGFVSGKTGMENTMRFGVVAATQHPQIDYKAVNYSDAPYANEPAQTMTYVSCHDNHTLFDRLEMSRPDATDEERLKMHRLALGVVLTSQGVPFLHAGSEMTRTKEGEENSYKSSDAVNQINWERKTTYKAHFDYIKDLVALRKAHPAFRMSTTEMIQQHLKFVDSPAQTVAYTISGNANGDRYKEILVVMNGKNTQQQVGIPKGNWKVVVANGKVNEAGLGTQNGRNLTIDAIDLMVLVTE